MVNDFKLSDTQPLSKVCIDKGLTHFDAVLNYIKVLPYGRTSNRSQYDLVLKESKGTCSTKHALLKAIALENNFDALELYLGIFKMNAENTPKLKLVLEQYDLEYIPEAHCYLKFQNDIIDITFGNHSHSSFSETLLHEETIRPEQIGDYKVEMHQSFLKSWLKNETLSLSFEELWNIREVCIQTISE